jgi:hypothetical protein
LREEVENKEKQLALKGLEIESYKKEVEGKGIESSHISE